MLYSISSNDSRVKLLMRSEERAVPLSSQEEARAAVGRLNLGPDRHSSNPPTSSCGP